MEAPGCARTEEMTSGRHAVAAVEVDHAARNALLKIAGLACDLQNLLDIWASAEFEDYQRDAAASASRGLATLIGAITATVGSDPPVPAGVSMWLLGGQA
ncbi:hypothetical protein DES41_102154 [Pseudorhodoferax soli]|uniref:Uncharacterized protein n=2 Tax=Pseudorhodoferax soli TaxID=545864 RepID=A0A368Y0I6_9BURK|nr:hypothetical protein DES41_102154 [Pseudorhodoferax soli]